MRITPRKYAEALANVLEESKDPAGVCARFLAFLRRKKQFRLLPKILKAFESEWNRRKGIVKIDVTYPAKFKKSLELLEGNIKSALGVTPVFQAHESSSIIGGFKMRMEDTLIDASIEGRLKALEQRLSSN